MFPCDDFIAPRTFVPFIILLLPVTNQKLAPEGWRENIIPHFSTGIGHEAIFWNHVSILLKAVSLQTRLPSEASNEACILWACKSPRLWRQGRLLEGSLWPRRQRHCAVNHTGTSYGYIPKNCSDTLTNGRWTVHSDWERLVQKPPWVWVCVTGSPQVVFSFGSENISVLKAQSPGISNKSKERVKI